MKYFLLLWSISFLLFGWWLNVTSDNSVTTMLVFVSGLVTFVGYIVLEKIDSIPPAKRSEKIKPDLGMDYNVENMRADVKSITGNLPKIKVCEALYKSGWRKLS